MRNLVAVPVILLTAVLQFAVISRIYLFSGIADLPVVMLAAWALQEDVDSSWHWAAAIGLLVGLFLVFLGGSILWIYGILAFV